MYYKAHLQYTYKDVNKVNFLRNSVRNSLFCILNLTARHFLISLFFILKVVYNVHNLKNSEKSFPVSVLSIELLLEINICLTSKLET